MKLVILLFTVMLASPVFADTCDKPRDDFDGIYCLNKAFQESDNALNSAYEELRSMLNDAEKDALKKTQNEWIKERNNNCSYRNERKVFVSLDCANKATIKRTREIRECITKSCQPGTLYSASQSDLKQNSIIANLEPETNSDIYNYKKDDFELPQAISKIPYRFALTSAINVDTPADRLTSINIGMNQKSFYIYVKLTGIDSDRTYTYRLRALDAKGELIFDNDVSRTAKTSSLWFVVKITPGINFDEPGEWTFQGMLNDEQLFVEKRDILIEG